MNKDYEVKSALDEPLFKAAVATADAQGLSMRAYLRRLVILDVVRNEGLVSSVERVRNSPRLGPGRAGRRATGNDSAASA